MEDSGFLVSCALQLSIDRRIFLYRHSYPHMFSCTYLAEAAQTNAQQDASSHGTLCCWSFLCSTAGCTVSIVTRGL